MSPRTSSRLWLAALALGLLALGLTCRPGYGSGGTQMPLPVAGPAPEEVARVAVTRPAVVVVERTAEGGIRVIVEYRPQGGPAPDPTPNPNPAPPPADAASAVRTALALLPPGDRRAFADEAAIQLAAVVSEGTPPAVVGPMLAIRLVESLGEGVAPAAALLARYLDAGPDRAALLAEALDPRR